MSSYQVIAKKFRPKKFSEVFEQDAIVQTIKNAIRLNKVGHAYLFCGTRGTGKTTLARLFAKALNCEALTSEGEPCNQCRSCLDIGSGHSLDALEIDGASNRGIDDIRNLNETVGYASSQGRHKIYIIDEVHMLTKEAFNALLKTLEEPPDHVVFFFATTEPHKVLPTIQSRCQRFDLRRITQEKIESKLSAITRELAVKVEPTALSLIASHAEGSLRDAESLLDQLLCYETPPITHAHALKNLGMIATSHFFTLDEAVKKKDLAAAFSISETIYQSGCHLGHFLESLAEHFRTIIRVQMGEKALLSSYQTATQIYSKHQALNILEYLIDSMERAQKTPFKRIHLETTLLHIIRSPLKIPIESLVERLEKLKSHAPSPTKEELPPPQPQATLPAEKAPVEEVPFFPESTTLPKPTPSEPAPLTTSIQEKIKHDQVMRFTSVAFNGTLKT